MSRRWWLIGAGAGTLALTVLAVWLLLGGSGERKDPIWERIQRDRVIRVGMEASFPPFETIESDQFVGYDVDLARELASRLGIGEVRFVNVHFDGLYDALTGAKCDIILSALPYERERTQDFSYTVPYFHAGQVLVVPNGSAIVDIEDLQGRTVAVEMGSQAHSLARQYVTRRGYQIEIVTAYSADEALSLLASGGADVAIADAVTALAYLGDNDTVRLASNEQLTDEPYVIAVPREAKVLLDELNRAIDAMRQDGSLAEIEGRWLR